MANNLILTGFMGTGKSRVGGLLATKMNRRFVDTDEWIVANAGKSIPQIFAEDGEAIFRQWEELAALRLADERDCVIATGGKLMLDPANVLDLGRSGAVVCLTAQPETILARLEDDNGARPLLAKGEPLAEITRLLGERGEGYGMFPQIATDHRIPAEIAELILSQLDAGILTPTTPLSTHINHSPSCRQLPSYCRHSVTTKYPPVRRELIGRLVVISDENVAPLYAAICQPDYLITLPAGEQYKTLESMGSIYQQLANAGIDRSATIVGLGGGVVGDMAGFASASYMRGVRSVLCPTSLLAMVDASVGGKTGVDLPQGKNLVGAFKQPATVLIDSETLHTLPDEELNAGNAENIKHGIIGSPALLEQIEQSTHINHALLLRSIQVKQRLVQADPFDTGLRMQLNLGHTFGHAIEQVSRYTVRHGEAVGIGLICSAHLSAKLGYCSPDLPQEVANWVSNAGLPTKVPASCPPEKLWQAMGSDKKKKGTTRRFVLIRDVGDVFVADDVPKQIVIEILAGV